MNQSSNVKLCECGCGQPAPIAKHSISRLGHVRGEPIRYIRGHNSRGYIGQDYTVEDAGYTSPCWLWRGHVSRLGYALMHDGGRKRPAHRVMYERENGPISDKLDLDHLCRNPPCVNPDHMEPVSHKENSWRGANSKIDFATAEEIRRLHATGNYSYVTLARRYKLHHSSISNIVLHKTWKR